MTYDVLAVGAHPDDIELGVAGTLALLAGRGYRVVLLDITRGSLSTRGDPETRQAEADAAAKVIGAAERLNLRRHEGSLLTNPDNLHPLVGVIRRLQPKLILAPYWNDRHPDHSAASRLVQDACFWAGVSKFGDDQPPHRPRRAAYYFCHYEGPVSLVVDVTATFDRKLAAVKAYRSQFALEPGEQPTTFISRPEFLEKMISRAKFYGSQIGTEFGEPLYVREVNRVVDLVAWTEEQGIVG